MKHQDITGFKFGKLTVISRCENDKRGKTRWKCVCECGGEIIVRANNLKDGTKSCGCSRKEIRKHGLTNERLYRIWALIKDRCNNKNSKSYKNYGGRGIYMCSQWTDDFTTFYQWSLENGYTEKLTIDRTDNDKGYFPSNCRWVTRKVQANNTRANFWIARNGSVKTLSEWCEITGVNRSTVNGRIRLGWEEKNWFKGGKEYVR